MIPGYPNLNAIRVIRVVKPLRRFKSLQGIQVLTESLLTALPALCNLCGFLTFLLILYGTLGIQLFDGILENRCRVTPEPVDGRWLVYENITHLCGYKACPM